ncbi:disease resistance protein At4g27190-like [Diospyros lotus]|uniref:disease resistance protein At4g27190-like n=1 Tax=Diospyros lotus TaxID=55363 RepID=UPI002257D5B4|nr:disease resistance protein At4g27190-like [Diospyros lotus]XP_052177249.1 disease resistance protein At4g27190-like [Diospyros lotus]XP_052177250.1 disease resistance protein At4g27190-like [Diospyros lotus]
MNLILKNIMDSCAGKILSFLADGVISQGDYVIQYKNHVQLLEQENKRLRETKDRIQGMVDMETKYGKVIEPNVSSWLENVEQKEGDMANFLHQQEDEESFKCFPGCMCPNLMWRHKRGMEAHKRKLDVSELISDGDRLEKSPVARDAPFQWETQFDSSQYYTMFSSRASVVDDIKNALKDSNVDMIGVHGPGGAGKTTMVKEVAKEAKKLCIFDKIVIAAVSKDPNTSKLQEDIATQLDLKFKQTNELGRADELRKALLNGERKILVTLDDLWQDLDLKKIGIPKSGLGDKGCKILLTSRREEVFKRMEVGPSVFSIDYLKEEEAWELFTKVTGDFGVDESTAKEVCKKCAGLPIAIVAVGAALKGEENNEWQSALHKLEKSRLKYIEGVEPQGYTPLKWSYEFLKDEGAQSCFLLCSLFDEDAEISIDELVRRSFASGFLGREVVTLEVARIKVQIMVNKLKKSCLLLNGAQRNFVKMHDVIRDLAISITKEKQAGHSGGQDWPKNNAWKHYTAMINDDNIHFPCDVFHCPLMHTLALKRGKSSLKIPNDLFPGMEEARVLALEDMMVDLPSLVLELNHLRMLELNNCQLLGGPSTIRCLQCDKKNHIEILNFKGSMIEELPQEIEELTHLRSLDMRECRRLKVIPMGVISKLINLEELYVAYDFKEWDTTTIYDGGMSNASIAELKSLSRL